MITRIISYVIGGLAAFFISSLFGGSLDVRNFCIWVLLAPSVALLVTFLCMLPYRIKEEAKREIKEEIKREIKEEEE